MKKIARFVGPIVLWLVAWCGGMFYMTHGRPIWLPFVAGAIFGTIAGIMSNILEAAPRENRKEKA